MSSSTVEQIKDRLLITDVVGSYLKLEKSGINFKAKCPFHNEKTASFFVSPERQSFHCFGCHAGGDMFNFVERFEGIDFKGALKLLAEKAGVQIENFKVEDNKEKEELFDILEKASNFFEEELKKNKEATKYLLRRGLKMETVSDWQVGYAPDSWRSLLEYMTLSGIKEDTLKRVGVIKTNEKGKTYDVFRDRVIFPIFDSASRVVGFSGRILKDNPQTPKYLNTPETDLFNKSKILYGLNKAKIEIRRKDFSIFVEGQMDLLACHQAGIKNTISTSGTALTQSHLEIIRKISKRVIFVFDADSAGVSASRRSTEMALKVGMEVKIAALTKGEDPASMIAKNVGEFRKTLKESKHIIEFILDEIISSTSGGKEKVGRLYKELIPYLSFVESDIEKDFFVKMISRKAGIKDSAIWEDIKNSDPLIYDTGDVDFEAPYSDLEKSNKPTKNIIASIISFIKSHPKLSISEKQVKNKISEVMDKDQIKEIEKLISDPEVAFVADLRYGVPDGEKILTSDIDEIVKKIEFESLKSEFKEETKKLDQAEEKDDKSQSEKIKKSIKSIEAKIRKIKDFESSN